MVCVIYVWGDNKVVCVIYVWGIVRWWVLSMCGGGGEDSVQRIKWVGGDNSKIFLEGGGGGLLNR